MIHICYAIHDPSGEYSRYVGISTASIFRNTESDVTIHLLHDETLTEENRARFSKLAEMYHQTVAFHEIDEQAFRDLEWMTDHHSVACLYRLAIADILPREIDRAIYLDADTFVHLDIRELWQEDLHGHALAACVSDAGSETSCTVQDGSVAKDRYFNSGVLVLDLKKIRAEHDLKLETLDYLKKHPESDYPDQDALNVIFTNDCKFLPGRYNRQLFLIPTAFPEPEERPLLLHFAGINSRINLEHPLWWERLYVETWCKTPWGTGQAMAQWYGKLIAYHVRQLESYQTLLAQLHAGRKIAFWGAASVLFPQAESLFHPDPAKDYFVDNREDLQGGRSHGLSVYPPEKLGTEERNAIVIIVLAKRAYPAIRKQLEAMGFRENEDFFDGRALLLQKDGGYVVNELE